MNSLGALLLEYYETHPRLLPWRIDPTPYHVWISEIMLQQTRVETVRGYYLRFLDAFPSIEDFANANEDEYLKLWEGLGYYSRVRNLHEAALKIRSDFAGAMPSTYEELVSLPGIGPYTASAISSIAFHQKEVAVDGNLVRIASRLYAKAWNPKKEKDKTEVRETLKKEMDIDPSVFNQALMDIGQTVCLPNGAPRCLECPLKGQCLAHLQKKERDYPFVEPKKAKKTERRTIVILEMDDLLYLEKRSAKGLLASLYQPLNLEGHFTLSEMEHFLENKGYVPSLIEDLGNAKHVFSHVVWEMVGYHVFLQEATTKTNFVSKKEKEEKYPVPSAFQYFLP